MRDRRKLCWLNSFGQSCLTQNKKIICIWYWETTCAFWQGKLRLTWFTKTVLDFYNKVYPLIGKRERSLAFKASYYLTPDNLFRFTTCCSVAITFSECVC